MDPTSSYGNLISFKSFSEGPCQALSETQAHFISWVSPDVLKELFLRHGILQNVFILIFFLFFFPSFY